MKKYCINIADRVYEWQRPQVMGIINVTPDSFSDASHLLPEEGLQAADRNELRARIIERARKHLIEGADILDIGGYSTRPGAGEVSAEEEAERVCLAANAIREEFPNAIMSVDTFRGRVARKAVREAGVHIINDISGFDIDSEMLRAVEELQVPYILSHTRGTPKTMQSLTDYDDLMSEIVSYFEKKISQLRLLGVKDIILDPCFGFAKTTEQNYELLRRMDELQIFGLPILAGVSHKSMIYKPLGISAQDALNGTTALHMVALQKGAAMLRVHEVKEAQQTITLYQLCSE